MVPVSVASRCTSRRGGQDASSAAEAEEVHRIAERTDPGLASPYVVARREIHSLDTSGKPCCLQQELRVCRPTAAGHERFVAERLQQIAQYRNAIETEGREEICITGFRQTGALDPPGDLSQSAHGCRSFRHFLFGGYDVGTTFKTLHQLWDVLGLVGEIRLH